ncbi:MAG: hypothetical protein ACREP9_17765 [Candidatus Dormibacteraceae bacterium]
MTRALTAELVLRRKTYDEKGCSYSMSETSGAVVGVYGSMKDAEAAVRTLLEHGAPPRAGLDRGP